MTSCLLYSGLAIIPSCWKREEAPLNLILRGCGSPGWYKEDNLLIQFANHMYSRRYGTLSRNGVSMLRQTCTKSSSSSVLWPTSRSQKAPHTLHYSAIQMRGREFKTPLVESIVLFWAYLLNRRCTSPPPRDQLHYRRSSSTNTSTGPKERNGHRWGRRQSRFHSLQDSSSTQSTCARSPRSNVQRLTHPCYYRVAT